MLAVLVVRSIGIGLVAAITLLGVATVASAQTIRPRGAAPAAPATAPAPLATPPVVIPPATPSATSLEAAREAREKALTALREARTATNAATTAAKGKAADSAEAKAVVEATAAQEKAQVAYDTATETLTTAGKAAFEQSKRLRPGERYMDGSNAESDYPSILTPAGAQVLLRECTYAEAPCSDITLYGIIMQLRHQLATPSHIQRAYHNTAINIGAAESRNSGQINRLRQSGLDLANGLLEKYGSWSFIGLIALAFFILVTLSVIGGTMIARRIPGGRTVARMLIFGTLIGYGLMGHANTASAQTAPKPAPACTIRSITTGAVVVKEQDPAPIVIGVRNCGDVKSVAVATGATDITFTDFATTTTRITAKVAATATALTGPTSFKLVRTDGTETVSPDAVYILVLDTATAVVRRDAAVATAKVTNTVTALKAEVNRTVTDLSSKLDTVASTRLTQPEVEALIAPLRQKVADLEMVNTTLQDGVKTNGERTDVLAQATVELAFSQEVLAKTRVKKGFWGKKPLAPEVSAAAERIRQAVAAVK